MLNINIYALIFPGKVEMEVEKVAPIAKSPLDSCRGRGKYFRLRSSCINILKTQNELKESEKGIVLLILPESPAVIGIANASGK